MILTVAALRTELLFAPSPRVAVGVGRGARARLRRALERRQPTGVVVVGYCGGLHASLGPGALLLAERVVGPKGVVRTGAGVLSRAAAALPDARVGPLVTVDRLAAPPAKASLGLDGLGVDLESAHLAEELFRRGTPFVVVRIVLDALWEDVPAGWRRLRWAPRALRSAWALGRAARRLRAAVEGR